MSPTIFILIKIIKLILDWNPKKKHKKSFINSLLARKFDPQRDVKYKRDYPPSIRNKNHKKKTSKLALIEFAKQFSASFVESGKLIFEITLIELSFSDSKYRGIIIKKICPL